MKRKRILISTLTLALLITLATGLGQAQGPSGRDISAQAALGTAFTYQGRLTGSGIPVTGPCSFTFALYD